MNPSVSWSDTTLPIRIYCAPGVLTGLEMVAADGLLAIPRTGLGVGGLLLGRRTSEGIEILKTLEIPCSHAFGPAFVLTADEIGAAESCSDQVVGWYCSKPHASFVLGEHDRMLFAA